MARRSWSDLAPWEKVVFGPAWAYTHPGPQTPSSLGILGKIHEAIDPVKAYGGYGGVLGAVMQGPGLKNVRLPSRPMPFEDVEGNPFKVLVNPRQSSAGRLLMGAKEGFVRTFGDEGGNLFMWSGDVPFSHTDLMEQMGMPLTSDNYAGAGVAYNPTDAMGWAKRFGGKF